MNIVGSIGPWSADTFGQSADDSIIDRPNFAAIKITTAPSAFATRALKSAQTADKQRFSAVEKLFDDEDRRPTKEPKKGQAFFKDKETPKQQQKRTGIFKKSISKTSQLFGKTPITKANQVANKCFLKSGYAARHLLRRERR